jgi:hypothetical protein
LYSEWVRAQARFTASDAVPRATGSTSRLRFVILKFETRNLKSKTQNPKPKIRSPKPETRNLMLENRSPQPEARNMTHEIRNPKPETRKPEPATRSRNQQHFSPLVARALSLDQAWIFLGASHVDHAGLKFSEIFSLIAAKRVA